MREELPPVDEELERLLEAASNGDLSPDDWQRLASRLEQDSQARAAFIQAAAMDAMLAHEFPSSGQGVAASALDLPDATLPKTRSSASKQERSRLSKGVVLALLGLAAALLMAIAIPNWYTDARPIATLASSENAAWESLLPTAPGAELPPGLLDLRTGIATIQFNSGAEVVVEAPAQLELISTMRARLFAGAAVVAVSDAAEGFVIETPNGFAVDHGTRFAVRVDRLRQQADFEIIDGEITLHHPTSGGEVRLTDPGQSATISEQSLVIRDIEQDAELTESNVNRVIRVGTNGRTGSAMRRDEKRHKFVKRQVLSVKRTPGGGWDHRSFFAFDVSRMDLNQVLSVRLQLNLVPSTRGFVSRLPKVNRFGVYGMTNQAKDGWTFGGTWADSPSTEDGVLLGTFEIPRSQQRGAFGIQNDELLGFLKAHQEREITFILARETTQIAGHGPGFTHLFASDAHPEAVGPVLEFTLAP